MKLVPPRLFGPLSECSRSVRYDFAIPGATIIVMRTRGGKTDEIGKSATTVPNGYVAFDPTVTLAGGDLVTAWQYDSQGGSDWQPDAIEVQASEGKFNPPQVLTHLYACSRGFILGAMRPGTRVEALDGGSLIATGVATDGIAYMRTVGGNWLPSAGRVLTVRQRVCPSPPPPFGATEWVIDHQLPPIEQLQSVSLGSNIPAPTITGGHTACSRAVTVANILPGAEVVLEGPETGWWSTLGPSDATTAVLPLPVKLREGEKIEVRQEFECRTISTRSVTVVGPPATLEQPRLAQIDCPTSPTIGVNKVKPGADIEYEVTHQATTNVYRGIAPMEYGMFPSPPMPPGASVRVRHGECDRWSPWSEPQIAKPLLQPVSKLRIIGELFGCQNAIHIENIFPLAGIIVVRTRARGPIAHVAVSGNVMRIPVAPSFDAGDEVIVEHQVCGQREIDLRVVRPASPPGIGGIEQPFDGDIQVTLLDVTDGAYIEIHNQSGRIASGFAPSSQTGKSNVIFYFPKALEFGQHIYATFWHCGHYGRIEGRPVFMRKPVLEAVSPNSVGVGSSDPTVFGLRGQHFRSGAMMWFEGAGYVSTTFLGTTELRGSVPGYHFNAPGNKQVQVRNPDGQVTGLLNISIVQEPAPPPEPEPEPTQPAMLEASQVDIFQCNPEHRDVHLWKKDLTAGTPWEFVATLAHQYSDDWATCGEEGSPAETIELEDGHSYAITAIDPENNGCIPPGGNTADASPPSGSPDEVNIACIRGVTLIIKGKSGALAFKHVLA